jgi:hypothetical protein
MIEAALTRKPQPIHTDPLIAAVSSNAPIGGADTHPLDPLERHELERDRAALDARQPHRVMGRASPLGRAAGVEYLEVVLVLVERDVRVAENDRVGVREPEPKASEPAAGRPGIVDDPERHAARQRDHALGSEATAQLERVHVSEHGLDPRPDRLDLGERFLGHDVAAVHDQVAAGKAFDADGRQLAPSTGHVRVRDDADQHRVGLGRLARRHGGAAVVGGRDRHRRQP